MTSSLYIHIPFCERKCIYCDFYSLENQSAMSTYVDALLREIYAYASYGEKTEFDTLFFGGGTPSLLSPPQLEAILVSLASTFLIRPDAEITVEVNPGTVDEEKLSAYRAMGVNRLSIGIQSFHDDELKFLGRIHNREEALRCYWTARRVGFENISVDLIFSIPGQGLERWHANLEEAVALGPEHLSVYSLIVEDGTPLSRMVDVKQIVQNPVEEEARQFELAMSFLADHGFDHYEVSNYAKPGFRSRHNSNYWSHHNYLGFGPSAHSFWQSASGQAARRWWNIASVTEYCERILDRRLPIASEEQLDAGQLITEQVFLGLRSDGVQLRSLTKDFGFDLLDRQREMINHLVEEQLAIVQSETLRLTPKGYLLCDEISERLLP